ncbi:MAG: large conductance mechanosensitive channel protein MscL [Actinomycetota bacterium]
MSIREEFTEFVVKGNIVDIAVGFVMGAAFVALVNALVADIIMPIIAIPFGEPSFSSIIWTINGSQILVGAFITAIIAFLMVAAGVFLFIVKPMNAYRAKTEETEEEEAPAGPSEIDLLIEIRDSLARRP